jgi:hypothetical protein
MFLRSCPLCDLAFGCANEVLWHVHHEHQCLTEEEQLEVEVARAAAEALDWANFTELRSIVDDVAISLLLPTTPAARLTSPDSAWLEHLAKSAYQRMAQELHPAIIGNVTQRLRAAFSVLEHGAKDKGLAILVSKKRLAIFWLPFSPRARASVGHAFAVRDLLDALQRFPRYRVVVIGGHRPRVLEGWAGQLDEVQYVAEGVPHSGVPEADALLADRLATSMELPLVVIGPARLLGTWRERSRHSSLLVGTVQTNDLDVPEDAIAKMAHPLVTLWREALTTVEAASLGHAERAGLVKWGLEPVWSALQDGSAEHLWVRRDFASPAVWQSTGWQLQVSAPTRVRGHSDDVVEELLRAARKADVTVRFFEKGVLPLEEPVGAQLAASRPAWGTPHKGHALVVDLSSQAQPA